jgi:hypothetical protein
VGGECVSSGATEVAKGFDVLARRHAELLQNSPTLTSRLFGRGLDPMHDVVSSIVIDQAISRVDARERVCFPLHLLCPADLREATKAASPL